MARQPTYLKIRNGTWFYQRRVPRGMAQLDTRTFVRESTGIKVATDKKGRRAAGVVKGLNRASEEYWKALVDGKKDEAEQVYKASRLRAHALGFDYAPVRELAQRPIEEILLRLELLWECSSRSRTPLRCSAWPRSRRSVFQSSARNMKR